MTAPQTPTPSTTPRTAAELRRAFLDFFTSRGHTSVTSWPLVPNDPTLLFTTAGMVQFKSCYTAGDDVPYTRAVSIQKCLRLTDLEKVGLTPRHDTFFEMLGNFSFGPPAKGAYFKAEAIEYAWEFVTRVLGLPKTRLYASIFAGGGKLPRDDEAAALWKKLGVADDHIVALGRADNFWGPAGGAGACGPCSEIYFDLGETRPSYLKEGAFWGERPGDAGDRYMEFWNLVFPQFDSQKDGTLTPLARPGIDTGMGLERLSLIVQGKTTIFETDLFEPLIERFLGRVTRTSKNQSELERDAKIVTDHMRAVTFALSEGVRPNNEGAGYVLRRLVRRAAVRARRYHSGVGWIETLDLVCGGVIKEFGGHYPELLERQLEILPALGHELALFHQTLEKGLELIDRSIGKAGGTLAGEVAFYLHDTYGFPIELTTEIAAERGVTVDQAGFERAMDEQRQRARAASKFGRAAHGTETVAWTALTDGPDSQFLGYDHTSVDSIQIRRWREREADLELVLDRTPAYAESGGQVADHGVLSASRAGANPLRADLVSAYKEGDAIVHRVKLASSDRDRLLADGRDGTLALEVDRSQRAPTQRHHTATHMLHAALRAELGTHVQQKGSLVAPDRLRFDYAHFEAPSREQLDRIERQINEWVLADRAVSWRVMPLYQAKKEGAMALFGEKYGAEVRMVTVDGVEDSGIAPSRELCGGTHVSRTGEIGAFALVSESAIASGVRRIEALCGHEALRHFRAERDLLFQAAASLQATPPQLPELVEKLKSDLATLRKAQIESQRGGLAIEIERLATGATVGANGRWVVAEIRSEAEPNAVRDAADALRTKLGRGAAVLALAGGGKLTFIAAVTDDLVAEKKLNASDLVKAVAQIAGGSGGGKPHLALAGGKEPEKLLAALDEARRRLTEVLGGAS